MKIWKYIISVVFWFYAITLIAQIKGNEVQVVVSPDNVDWTYNPEDKCTFNVQVYKNKNLLKGVKIDYELGPDWYPQEKKEGILLKDGKYTLTGKMEVPGFFRCKVWAHVGENVYEGLATVAYAPEQIKDHAQEPADFELFWNNMLESAHQVPLSPAVELLPDKCTDKVNVYHVSFQNMQDGMRIYGILCMPKAKGKYPALLRVPGAGVRSYPGDVETASKGAITLEIGVHGIPVNMPQSIYDILFKGALLNYQYQNDNNRNYIYYKRVFTGAIRAVDFIASLPEYDGKTLGVTGASQGGALSIVVAALDRRITFYAAIHPAMCDHRAHLHQVAGGWPHYLYYFPKEEKRIATIDYYDMVNFAKQIKVPGWFSWGYNDEVCPPTSMFAAYNRIQAPKELHPYLETGHYWYQEQYDEWNRWLWKQLGL